MEIRTKPKSFFHGKNEEVTTPYQYIETVQTAINKFYAKHLSEKLPKVIVKLTRQLHMMRNIWSKDSLKSHILTVQLILVFVPPKMKPMKNMMLK